MMEEVSMMKILLTVEEQGIVFVCTPSQASHRLNEVIPRQ